MMHIYSSAQKRLFLAVPVLLLSFLMNAQISFPFYSSYKYLKGIDAQNLDSVWINPGFDDSDWVTSEAPFFYGDDYADNLPDGKDGTPLLDMHGNYSALFLRSTFEVSQLDAINSLLLKVDWEDGYILWINGVELVSEHRPKAITFDAVATSQHDSGKPSWYRFLKEDLNLVEGENTIAVLACNILRWGSLDFFFDMSLSAETELPAVVDSVGVEFSQSSGFYIEPFNLTLSTSIPDASIVYTIDGSNPQYSITAAILPNVGSINIDPNSHVNRGTTPAVIVRASVIKDGFKPSQSTNKTYVFIENVKNQSYPGHDWPNNNVNEQDIDYDMINFYPELNKALTDIPTISLITDNTNLFGEHFGIYVNALERGKSWERECTIEMFDSNETEGFYANAGLRIRGGYSRKAEYPKHAFHLFFREKYGTRKLNFPLFDDEGVDYFDKIDLRCAQNYSYNNESSYHNTLVREVFARDAQGDAEQPYTRSRYYHLYLNGMYWGIYQTQERADAKWAADYLGGNNEDYDVIKSESAGDSEIIAVDGTLDKWKKVYDLSEFGFEKNEDYFKLEGKDENGNPAKQSEVLVDIDNLIDYMLNIFFTGNVDGPVSKSSWNTMPENMYAITNRTDKSIGFKFLVHDAERIMLVGEEDFGNGLQEDRVNIGYEYMVVDTFSYFHPQWLHYKLCGNLEYRQRFINIAWKRLFNNGVFTYNENIKRLNNRTKQIEKAIMAELARWGDAKGSFLTKEEHWLPELDTIRNEYLPFRNEILLEQLSEHGLFSKVSAPLISIDNQIVTGTQVFINSEAKVTFSSETRDIYLTTNGINPRLIGGGILPIAQRVSSGTVLNINESMVLKMQCNKYGAWSPLHEVRFIKEQTDYSHLKVTELHYHPSDSINSNDTINGKAYEFIEFRNTDTNYAINLSGLVIDSAIYYEFPDNKLLSPGEFYVIAAKPKMFYDRYGKIASGNYTGSLSNSSERIVITNSKGELVMDFTYKDQSPWPTAADGTGVSLSSVETRPTGDPSDHLYWMASSVMHGTPFSYDALATSINDFSNNNGFAETIKVYPNPTNDLIEISVENSQYDEYQLKIFDLSGVSVFQKSYNTAAQISMNSLGLNFGMYILSIENKRGLITRKIIYSPN